MIREEWIKTMEVRLVRDELTKCHRAEGENHYHVCAPIARTYRDLLQEAKVRRRAALTLTADQGVPHCRRVARL